MSKKHRAAFESAAQLEQPVRVLRRIRRADSIVGFVVGLSDDWVLLHVEREIVLHEYIALRIADVKAVDPYDETMFMQRGLRALDQLPVAVDVDVSSIATIAATATAVSRLLTVHTEVERPDVCFIGIAERVTKKNLWLRHVGPNADWDKRPNKHALADITRLDFGGSYERALSLVAGDPTQKERDDD